MFDALEQSPALLYFAVVALGLCVGSFLNVVAWRLPLMMERDFRAACHEQFGVPELDPAQARISLWRPGSHCPHCKHPIRPWHNLPVLGWLLLRGRCADCGARISVQYPLAEACAGVLGAVCVWRFGFGWELTGALLLVWTLLALSLIDLRTQYLPDDLTLPLLWLGLLASIGGVFADPVSAIVGAALGYGVLWGVFKLFLLLTGKEGMGYGDFKLMAALGAWLGWQMLPLIVVLSALTGAVVGITLIALRRSEWSAKLPFGPYIAAAGVVALFWGDTLMARYLGTLAS